MIGMDKDGKPWTPETLLLAADDLEETTDYGYALLRAAKVLRWAANRWRESTDNLTSAQARCTSLLDEARAARRELKAALAETVRSRAAALVCDERAKEWQKKWEDLECERASCCLENEERANAAVDALAKVYATVREENPDGARCLASVPGNAWDVIVRDRDTWKRKAEESEARAMAEAIDSLSRLGESGRLTKEWRERAERAEDELRKLGRVV